MHFDVSTGVDPVQLCVTTACVSQVLHFEQLVPLPKYPALQVQVDVSVAVAPVQGPVKMACVSQVLQGEQLTPVPKYPALQVQVDVSEEVDPVQAPDRVACGSQVLHDKQVVPASTEELRSRNGIFLLKHVHDLYLLPLKMKEILCCATDNRRPDAPEYFPARQLLHAEAPEKLFISNE